jgi:hypothetical protein
MIVGGRRLLDWALISSMVALAASPGPCAIMSCQRFRVASRIISGLPSRIAEIVPIPSEWSLTAT